MKNFNLFRNVAYFSGSVFVFFAGMIIYGIILNLREITLNEAMISKELSKLGEITIIIDRSNYQLDLYSDTVLVKRYKVVFGKNRSNLKTSAFDYATPIGNYNICIIDTNTQYHKFLKLNYPNRRDAAEALKNHYINKSEHDKIIQSYSNNNCSQNETPLGANIGIHGTGEYDFIFKNLPFIFNWTNGSIAVSNENIDELFSVVKIGTKVKIIN